MPGDDGVQPWTGPRWLSSLVDMAEPREHHHRCDRDDAPDGPARGVDGRGPRRFEVLSPSTRAVDSTLKRHVFEQGGVPAYWQVDPFNPSLTVLELVDGAYVESAVVTGAQSYDAELPFPVRVVPADLLR